MIPEINGEGRWLGTTAYQFRPSEQYKQATTYYVKVHPGITSQDGGTLKDGYAWQFSSEKPKILAVSPADHEMFASPTASIAAFFSQPIDRNSLNGTFMVYDGNGKGVPGDFKVSGNIVGFYPSSPLTREMRYSIKITPGIQSTEGPNGMDGGYFWSFNTAGFPGVVSSQPVNGQKEVTEDNRASVSFRTPMDPDSFKGNVTINPAPDMPPGVNGYNTELNIGTYFGRSKTYTITVGPNVKDQYGVPLGKPYSFTFSTAAYTPSVTISPNGTYFGAFNQQVVPRIVAQVVNTNRVDYSLYKLSRSDFLELYSRRYSDFCSYTNPSCRNWQDYDPSKLQKVKSWQETFQADMNTPVTVVTKVTAQNGGNIPSGFYLLDLKIPQGGHDNMVMIVSKSALTVKKSDNQIFAWDVNQMTTQPVSGMNMELTNLSGTVMASGTTNSDGVFMKDASLGTSQANNLFMFGQKGDDVVVAASAWNEGINTYDFGLPSYYDYSQTSSGGQAYKMFITLDRPIYRPGQKVYFKGVVRKDNDGAYQQVEPGMQVNAVIKDLNGHEILSKMLPLNSFGSFSGDFTLSSNAALGSYSVGAFFLGNSYSQQFQVEEYKKPELAVNISPSKTSYIQGETAQVTINASYYYGAPVTQAPVTWSLQTQDNSFRWEKDWRFEFGDPDSYWSRPWWDYTNSYYSGKQVSQGTGTTDSKGNLNLSFPLDLSTFKTGQSMIIWANINDISNQYVAGSSVFTVHKAGIQVGLKPQSYGNSSGQETKVELVTVDTSGKEVPQTPVTVEFYKRTWETVREQNPDDGMFYYTSKPSDSLVDTKKVTTDSFGHATASFTPSEAGTYKVVGKVTDKAGNQNVSGTFLWVWGAGFSTARENNDRIIVATDKQDYLVGENMSVFVASPFASDSAKTLLTVERGNVLSYKVVDTNTNSNNFVLPVTGKDTPNAFVGAVLVKGGNQVKNPAEFKMGYSAIKVTDKKLQLDVAINTDKQKYKPRETLKATIVTKDMTGKPVSAEVAVGLVDKAIFDLSNIVLPDIYKTFYQPRSLGVSTSQLLTISIDRINANTNLGSKGGSGGGCFTGDTPVLMKGGVSKNMKDIKVGDVVLTRESENSPKLVEAKVLQTFKHVVDSYLILNGELKVTPIHKMFVNHTWTIAGNIRVGDWLVDKDNHMVQVFSKELVKGKFDVYNLTTETYHTYFAGGIYVHNQKGGGEDTSRFNFPDTAYWNPGLATDKNGKATIEIPLPDSLTTWRLAAIANTDGAAFGSNTSEVVVSRDVLIKPFTPRFLSVGDQAKLGMIVANTSGQDQKITASISGDGITFTGGAQQQTIPDGGQVKLTWDTVTQNTTKAKIKMHVENADKSLQDGVEVSLPVKTYWTPETVSTAGQAKDTARENVSLPKDVVKNQGQTVFTLSPSLGAASFDSMQYLIDYPYYCTEQSTSRFMPAVFVHRILKNAKIEKSGMTETKELEQVISDGIQRLNNMQHADGGWGWWIESDSDPFVTAYAMQGLLEAKHDGFTVDEKMVNKGINYLSRSLAGNVTKETQAFILYVLRSQNINFASYASNLFDKRFEMSLEGRAYLALYMKQAGMGSQAGRIKDELIGLAKKTATTTHWEEPQRNYWWSMGSNTVTTAAMLELVTSYDRNSPLIPEVVRYLMNIRVENQWASTRDTAAVIKAISTQLYARGDQNVDENYRLTLNGKTLFQGKFTQKDLLALTSYTVGMGSFTIGKDNKVEITKSGNGNLYYNMNLKYYLPFTQIAPLERGMVVVREMVDSKGNILPSDTIAENTEVWERLIIVAPEERHFVMIEDPLPAGLESVNESLKNVSSLTKAPPKKDKKDSLLYFTHKEYHDDRTTLFADYLPAGVYEVTYRVRATTPGMYHRPPAQAYQMYTPDVSGHSDGGWLTVK
ncbi:MAG: Ig-like domain-containing protein [Candidatus Levyibacteriota bacterium]